MPPFQLRLPSARLHVRADDEGVDGASHSLSCADDVLADFARFTSHARSSFIEAMATVGTGGPAFDICRFPTAASAPAIARSTAATMSADAHAGRTIASAT